MPAGEEETARKFYSDLLGMEEIPKPRELAKRGGCWFESGGRADSSGSRRPLPAREESSSCIEMQRL